ncbi:MAG TPA: AMP-dependent synthetase, partial [Phytomonospora sp.]
VDAVFVSRERAGSWLETVPEAPHRFLLGPGEATPDGYRDFLAEAHGRSTAPPDYLSIGGGDAAGPDGTSYHQWGELARAVADAKGLRRGDRVLIDTTATEEPSIWLLAPLAAGASIVLCAGFDEAGRRSVAAAEGVTRSL